MEKNVLVVCRDLSDVGIISRISPETGYGYVLASDDPRVHKIGRQYPWICKVGWLEQMASLHSVANKTMECIETVNGWLKSLGNDKCGVSPDLLFWIRHVEGGITTQRIQDAMLLINTYLSLFDENNIQSIVLIRRTGVLWEDNVLIETANARGITIKAVGGFILYDFVKRAKNLFKEMVKPVYYLFSTCFNIWRRIKSSTNGRLLEKNKLKKEIIFQLCGWHDKHVNNIVPIMKAVNDMGYYSVALCWQADSGAERVRESGLAADELEGYVTLKDIWFSCYRILQTCIKAIKLRPDFVHKIGLSYEDVPLGRLLWPSILYYLTAELLQWCVLNDAIKKYFSFHRPLAIKLWGGGTLIEGHLAMKYIDQDNKPLLMYWFWSVMDYPYESNYEYIDLFLASGKLQEMYLKQIGATSDRIALTGMARHDFIGEFKNIYSREDSLRYLKIPSYFKYCVLYDPNVIMRGFQMASEQAQVMEALLNVAKINPAICLLVKPHPGHSPGMLEEMIAEYTLQNVFLLNKDMAPNHALNVADVLITKLSTIGYEAMLFECPVISVILDGDEKFKVFGDAAEYIMTSEVLSKFFNVLVKDDEFRDDWKTQQIRKQKAFMKDYFFESELSSAILSAEAIDQHIKKHYDGAHYEQGS